MIIPFAFHEQTKDWLAKCEFEVEPPPQAVIDFDALAKRQEFIKLHNERLGEN